MALADRIARHAAALERDGRSPLYVELMRGAAGSAAEGGAVAEVFADGAGSPGSVPALRLMAALHQLVLSGRAPELARFYGSVGGDEPPKGAWESAQATIEHNLDEMRALSGRTVQTNEPGRSAVLYGALLWLADRHRRPVRLLEVGASAGLNLHPDRYEYVVRGRMLSEQGSALSFVEPWEGTPVRDPWSAQSRLAVVERRGCDRAPVDVRTEHGRLTVLSYIWPDESERLARIDQAIEIFRRHDVRVEVGSAAGWVAERLAERRPAGLTVVWQSVVRQYLTDAEREDLDDRLARAGALATDERPMAWVALEPAGDDLSRFGLTCRTWPRHETVMLASSGYHGPPVTWSARAKGMAP